MAQFEGLMRRRTAAEGTSTRRPRHSLGPSGRCHLKFTQQRCPMVPLHSTPPHLSFLSTYHTHTPGSVSSLRGREVRWPRHIPHTTPPPLCPVCFHHAASLAPSSSSHSRSRRTMLKRASPALEHSDKTDHQTELSPVRDSRRGSVSCSSHGIQFYNRLTGAIREMVHACLFIDTLLSATPTCSQLFSFVAGRALRGI